MGCAPQNEGANERLEVRKERMTGSLQNTLPDCLKGQGGRGSRGPCREPDSARTRNSQGWEVRVPSSPSNKCLAVVQEVMERWASLAGSEQQQQRRRRFTMTDLKHQAAEYYRSNEVPQRLEEVLNAMFYLRPEDFYGHLANYFSELSKPPVICKLVGKRVLDGTGHPILEVELSCRVKNHDKSICSSMICSHAEILENASSEAVDADERQRYESINTAIEWINESLNEMLRGLQPTDQHKVDELLCEYFTKKAEEDKERWETEKERETLETAVTPSPPHTAPPGKKKSLKPGKKASFMEKLIPPLEPIEPVVKGSMAIGCISLAVAKAAAMIRDIPLYLHIASLKHNEDFPKELAMPLPMVTVLSCGKSSPGKLNLMKEVMLIPPAWLTVKQGIERCLDVQKEMLKLIESLCKAASAVAESKKATAKDAGKKAPVPVLKKMSPLGCLLLGNESLEQPLTLIHTACAHLSLELGIDMHLGINCAAHELMDYNKGKYEILLGTFKSPDEMVDMYVDLIHKFPYVIALIDPLRKEDAQQWTELCNTLGSKCYLIAENSCRNVSKLLEDQNRNAPKCSGFVVKYTNETKISDLLEMTQHLGGLRRIPILGSPDGESSDDSLVDLVKEKSMNLLTLLKKKRKTMMKNLITVILLWSQCILSYKKQYFRFGMCWYS
ncbi:enolase 4 isoform X2 [Hemicordylus capensis]|uniref:enolase 4 isoform X2 n=1 Tax=Hemicordylus capensis TaxID=884348 RepID=UPI0023022358|nr:enolase 4 isoform X2 [Hemicordylus capensis]